MSDSADANLVELAAELTAAWLANSNTRANVDDVPVFLKTVHGSLTELASNSGEGDMADAAAASGAHSPAVSVRKSLASKDHIVSMIDGKSYKTLRRHLAKHGLTPDDYRQRYGLKPDYPMVSENYSQARRDMAKQIGLGRKPGTKAPQKRVAGGAAKRKSGAEGASAE